MGALHPFCGDCLRWDLEFFNERQVMVKGNNVLTTGDVSRICNVAPRTVQKWFDAGVLGGYLIPLSKDRRIALKELRRFMKAHNIPLPDEAEPDEAEHKE